MYCIYNLSTRQKRGSKLLLRLFVFIVACTSAMACINNKSKLDAIAGVYASELQQVKKTNAGIVSMLLMPSSEKDSVTADDVYNIRITLKASQAIKKVATMQYMNFDIRNSFWSIQGTDTMPCLICERIPGISENEFLYMTRFNKVQSAASRNKNLRLLIDDTVAGFGETVFDIKKEALEKPEQ